MPQIRFRLPTGIPFYPNRYISHWLIGFSVLITISFYALTFILSPVSSNLVEYFALQRMPIRPETLIYILSQISLYQFLHGDILHLFLNAYFLYQAWPEVETRMKRREFLLFFFGNTFFVATALWFLSSSPTIGISGFCMALLSYLYMNLQATRNPMANQVLIMLLINVGLGLFGNISFVGHAAGAVFGIMWWIWRRR